MKNNFIINLTCMVVVFWAVAAYFGPLAGFGVVAGLRLLMPYQQA